MWITPARWQGSRGATRLWKVRQHKVRAEAQKLPHRRPHHSWTATSRRCFTHHHKRPLSTLPKRPSPANRRPDAGHTTARPPHHARVSPIRHKRPLSTFPKRPSLANRRTGAAQYDARIPDIAKTGNRPPGPSGGPDVGQPQGTVSFLRRPPATAGPVRRHAPVAQGIEQRPSNPPVGGSIPSWGTRVRPWPAGTFRRSGPRPPHPNSTVECMR